MLATLAGAPTGVRRSNELHRLFPTTPKRTLTLVLRRLEEVGVVKREVFAEVPVRVEYSLTPLGDEFVQPVRWLTERTRLHPDELEAVGAKGAHVNPSAKGCNRQSSSS